jgi:hypothetical protein
VVPHRDAVHNDTAGIHSSSSSSALCIEQSCHIRQLSMVFCLYSLIYVHLQTSPLTPDCSHHVNMLELWRGRISWLPCWLQ